MQQLHLLCCCGQDMLHQDKKQQANYSILLNLLHEDGVHQSCVWTLGCHNVNKNKTLHLFLCTQQTYKKDHHHVGRLREPQFEPSFCNKTTKSIKTTWDNQESLICKEIWYLYQISRLFAIHLIPFYCDQMASLWLDMEISNFVPWVQPWRHYFFCLHPLLGRHCFLDRVLSVHHDAICYIVWIWCLLLSQHKH